MTRQHVEPYHYRGKIGTFAAVATVPMGNADITGSVISRECSGR